MLIRGKCHCGNIVFQLAWAQDPPEIPARACDCSFCVKHGGVWTSHPDSRLTVTITDAAKVSEYAFGTSTAIFHVCSTCGAVPVVTSEIAGKRYAVVNVNVLEGVDPSWLCPRSVAFGTENVEARLGRRRQYWIGNVEIDNRVSRT